MINYPLGLPRFENSDEALDNGLHSGFNFSIGTSFISGGIISMTGYIIVLYRSMSYAINSLLVRDNYGFEQVVSVSLICLFPFIFQRPTIWESGLFSLLFAPYLIRYLSQDYKIDPSGKFS